ncbi:hypothetical protein COY29_00125 [Candidatus Woesebacteria bacterium CG_4_10_14_0_2_um_filter_39_14]|uniref:Uncharacterized protein n=3 Tax=Microgenomates group TaxID=1794810 RepID=A0A2M6YPI5_9BACT|nr:MAG: hypothetical protein COT04_02310 [Candidatus Shapirobacteria bacterium CG07_land_8_20_14_0_80_39_12]PIZ50267.1 MAG: hypothetical protein COY29_00125 [Candidatus Woesebacteria bacterium CG_4_10_14_0_2_um_filter_39_14]PJA49597.1 MAG: hypothetical protein CO169_01570 [Candidatus Shapirobacteria bacterium CG_4_9_14_3_um_filter_39_13]
MPERVFLIKNMTSVEIQKGEGKHPEFLKGKEKLEELHKKLIERAISVIKPASILNGINKEFLKSKGEVIKQSLPCLKIFDLDWTDCYVELSGYHLRHQITIAFCSFLVGPNQVIKNVNQLLYDDTPKGAVYPGFAVLGGPEAKAIRNDWGDIAGVKNISSLNPDTSTVFGIPIRLREINKANLIKGRELSLKEALRKALINSALKE